MSKQRKTKPAESVEARENQLINLAVSLAEQQLKDGTASAQVISHYLKLGSTTNKIEKEILSSQKELMIAKTEALKDNKHLSSIYEEAIMAMKSYNGLGDKDE